MNTHLDFGISIVEPAPMSWEDFQDHGRTAAREVHTTLVEFIENLVVPDTTRTLGLTLHKYPWTLLGPDSLKTNFNRACTPWYITYVLVIVSPTISCSTLRVYFNKVGIAQLAGL